MISLGGVGLWSSSIDTIPAAEVGDFAAAVEEQGWTGLWFGEAYGREAFTQAQLLLAGTSRLVVGTGIANIWARDAMATAGASKLLDAVSGGRFVLGLGVSHQPLVQRMRGHDYAKPVAAMKDYLSALDAAGSMAAEGPAPRPTRVLAALGPAMLDVAREQADGTHPYLVTPEHTAKAREAVGPDKIVAVEQAVVLTQDRAVAMERGHAHLNIYTGLPNYRNNWERLGFDPATDFIRGGSERLVEALVTWGDVETIKKRVDEHVAAGASHVCLQVLMDDLFTRPDEVYAELAPAFNRS